MDLRTIMNSDAAGASNNNNPTPPSRQSPSQASISHPESAYPPRQQQQPQHASSSSSVASYPPGYPGRPAQPPPLQPPHASPDRSSSYGSIQSPYRYNPASGLNASASSQRGQSPPAAVPPSHAYSRSASASYTPHELQHHQPQQQSAGPLASPYKPQPINTGIQHPEQQQSYFAQQRSQPIQETPPSASSHPFQSQQFSPSAHGSLPGTPLGPPPASYTRHSPSAARPPSAGHDSQSNQPSSPWVRHNSQMHDQRNPVSPITQSRNNSQVEQTPRQHPLGLEREQSESVSPKTLFTPGSRQGSTTGSQDQTGPFQRNRSEDITWKDSPTGSASGPSQSGIGPGAQVSNSTPTTAHRNSSPPPLASLSREIHPGDKEPTLSTMMDVTPDSARSSPHPPKRKRMRYDEPPIYAQRSSRTKGKCPPILNRLPPVPKHARDSIENPWTLRKQSSSSNAPAAPPAPIAPSAPAPVPGPAPAPPAPKVKAEEATTVNGPPVSHSPAAPSKEGSLGSWEPSITGFIPHEETTKLVCDFLFQHVVLRNDVGAGPAGSSAVGHGAIIEVEAKLGQLIDMDRGDRLRLPIMTESVLNKEGSRLRTSFESSMTLAQHRAMNNFLNETVKSSMPQNNPGRIPISYAHKKERDTFYEVSPSELPPVIRQNLNPRHKPRVRVTTDQRTGEVLAKIVKCRVADMDVHSPRTCVDWRVSVNLEMSYEGDVSHLPIIDTAKGGRSGDRNKDRMSYRHLAYQVDLTQVAKSEIKGDFEHELEVEVSAAEIRRQGQLAMTGDPKNQYEDLVKGFVDNIRILARTVPP